MFLYREMQLNKKKHLKLNTRYREMVFWTKKQYIDFNKFNALKSINNVIRKLDTLNQFSNIEENKRKLIIRITNNTCDCFQSSFEIICDSINQLNEICSIAIVLPKGQSLHYKTYFKKIRNLITYVEVADDFNLSFLDAELNQPYFFTISSDKDVLNFFYPLKNYSYLSESFFLSLLNNDNNN